MDKQNLKKPYVWVVAVAVILGIWTLYSTAAMLDQRQKTDKRWQKCREVLQQAEEIQLYQRRAGNAVAGDLRTFQGEASARECAHAASIPVTTRLQRGESTQKILKSGERQYTETYKLHAVRLVQVSLFIDYAETNFTSLDCVHLQLIPSSITAQDSWDVTIGLRYIGL
jgi:hypothetical protein